MKLLRITVSNLSRIRQTIGFGQCESIDSPSFSVSDYSPPGEVEIQGLGNTMHFDDAPEVRKAFRNDSCCARAFWDPHHPASGFA